MCASGLPVSMDWHAAALTDLNGGWRWALEPGWEVRRLRRVIFACLQRKPRAIRNVDYAEEKHYGEHWADSRKSEVLGVCQERQEQSKQENGGGYDPPRTVFSALAHHSLNIREIRCRRPFAIDS